MILKHDFPFGKENRPLHIYLPDNWEQRGERYPVLYFFDGHNLFSDEEATYGKSWGFLDFLAGWEKELIIVGMECAHGPGERLSEYLPYPMTGEGAIKRFGNIEARGEETFRWIIQEVKPYIDRNYPTIPFRECCAIGGSSMGGLMAIYGALHHNRWFSKGACISSAIGFCRESMIEDLAQLEISGDTRLYLSWGSKEAGSDTRSWNEEVAALVEERGGSALTYCQEGGGHCEADWEKLVPDFMDHLWMR